MHPDGWKFCTIWSEKSVDLGDELTITFLRRRLLWISTKMSLNMKWLIQYSFAMEWPQVMGWGIYSQSKNISMFPTLKSLFSVLQKVHKLISDIQEIIPNVFCLATVQHRIQTSCTDILILWRWKIIPMVPLQFTLRFDLWTWTSNRKRQG